MSTPSLRKAERFFDEFTVLSLASATLHVDNVVILFIECRRIEHESRGQLVEVTTAYSVTEWKAGYLSTVILMATSFQKLNLPWFHGIVISVAWITL